MTATSAELDRKLRQALCDHARKYDSRYTPQARDALLEVLFRSLTADRIDYLQQLFPQGFPPSYRLQDAEEVEQEPEYTPAAKGHPCGHILKQGEASYHCATCTDDPTAVLCAPCFAASDHEGHQLVINISGGNSGCCDCGDEEAWKRPVNCAIHTAADDFISTEEYVSTIASDLQTSIRTTISRVLDFFCDVISCSPENLRLPKSVESVRQDEEHSRLTADNYVSGDNPAETNPEFCLLIWNDEKHTINEVRDQVTRACRERARFGDVKAQEANDYGRSVVRHSRDLDELIKMAKLIEHIKITVTIRSSRDTFREQMCGSIIDWLSDIASCTIAGDSHILRRVVCEEMLQLWRKGSQAWNLKIGKEPLDTHGIEQGRTDLAMQRAFWRQLSDPIRVVLQRAAAMNTNGEDDDDDDDMSDVEEEILEMVEVVEEDADEDTEMANTVPQTANFQVDDAAASDNANDADATDDADDMDTDVENDFLDMGERIEADPLSPPAVPIDTGLTPTGPRRTLTDPPLRPDESANYMNVPKHPTVAIRTTPDGPPPHWILQSSSLASQQNTPVHEDLTKNIRIDSMILFDLRLWKIARTSLRDLYISTIVKIPQFKRILGLRFSGLYITLAQLYLVADREPDHSIINLSLQILTTPSICQEVVEKGNFLTYLMAILYTYMTTKAVGFPRDVDPGATLAYDAGAVANRRLFHFFADLKYFLASNFVQEKIRGDTRYLSQYLDLIKICQGICPNVRAVGEHVEYETDAWISAALLTREVNKLCRQFAETYQPPPSGDLSSQTYTFKAIGLAAEMTMMNCLGLERKRFEQSEIKDLVHFHATKHRVVQFSVEKGAMSFHHPLHYSLSWLLESGKDSTQAIEALQDAAKSLMQKINDTQLGPKDSAIKTTIQSSEDALLAMFDYPLRVCAWLAQMKANMWVRNGMSLRHQMGQYKSVPYRDVAHQRDLFLLQTALVTCDPSRVLVSMIDRFGLTQWMSSKYSSLPACEDVQMLDLAEDLVYLLINLLSDRDTLTMKRDDPESALNAVRKEIAHSLCFKSMAYTDLVSRLTERVQDHEKLQEVLDNMTTFRAPEGLNDTGLLSLKEEYLAELDPYNSHFSKNQRDEAENVYKKWMGKKLKKDPEEVVLEPKLHPITSEAYTSISTVVHTLIFAETIYRCLVFAADGYKARNGITPTRVESFLQIVLQLALIATLEDKTDETYNQSLQHSFIYHASGFAFSNEQTGSSTVVRILHKIWQMEDFSACRSKIRHILRLFHHKQPRGFVAATESLDFPSGRFDTASPANIESEIEAKKKQAMERKAKVMAQFQAQQQSFMDKSGFDWDEEALDSPDTELPSSTESRQWKYPAGLCIQCREETNDSRLYGTFAMITDGHILRETIVDDPDFVDEVLHVPADLDRSIEHDRPFGVAGSNKKLVTRMNSDGEELRVERQGLSKGWPKGHTMKGPLTTSCGHIMHFACFENYYQSVIRRHSQQVARNHPERVGLKEFVCPLCKALANAFLPIIWKSTVQSYPGSLAVDQPFSEFLEHTMQRSPLITDNTDAFQRKAMEVNAQAVESFASNTLTSGARGPDSLPDAAFTELTSVYLRLREPLATVARSSLPEPPPVKYNHLYLLLDSFANTIAATEIAYRGRDAEFGSTLLSSIPQQTLSHLQILASTIRAYSATCTFGLRGSSEDYFRETTLMLQGKLFGDLKSTDSTHLEGFLDTGGPSVPLLGQDAFQFLVHASMILCPIADLSLHHMLRLSLVSCILRVVIAYTAELNASEGLRIDALQESGGLQAPPNEADEDAFALVNVLQFLLQHMSGAQEQIGAQNDQHTPQCDLLRDFIDRSSSDVLAGLVKIVKAHVLTFLRDATILFHVAHGVDYPTTAGSEATLPELDRLLHYLQLPSIAAVVSQFHEYHPEKAMQNLVATWIWDWMKSSNHEPHGSHQPLPAKRGSALGIRLLHPAPLELIGLPKYYDVLLELSSRRKCPTTGRELSDPALCLFCGDIFCSQSVCCMASDGRGGCNMHVEKCSAPLGMFLFIRKCHVVLLHVQKDPKMKDRQESGTGASQGSFFQAPYLTKHGETDSGLRTKTQLILSQKRYDRLLREAWLCIGGGGSVWSSIARKLESEVNAGGWETL